MKKLYAILLGLALTLGFATVASAYDLTVNGEFDAYAEWDGGFQGIQNFDVAVLTVDLKGAMGDNASGELKFGFDWIDFYNDAPPGHWFYVALAKLQYNITDGFYAGVYAAQRHDGNWYRFFYSAVNGGEGFNHALGHIFYDDFVNVYAGFKFDGGQIDAYTSLEGSWYIKGTYAADALSVTGWFAEDNDAGTIFIGKVKYAFSDVFNATAGVLSNNGDVYLGLWGNVALEDVADFKAYLEYEVSPFYNNDYWFMATLLLLGDFQPFFEWDESDGISIGWDYYLGASDLWGEYWFDGNVFQVGVDILF